MESNHIGLYSISAEMSNIRHKPNRTRKTASGMAEDRFSLAVQWGVKGMGCELLAS